ncbi:hypothetical protein [Microvirga terricola]|uniref:Uncharacterized protein n=1 Tax=Microvirga terricola TaxID=2719797 RepID=A0ABX0V7Z8_9HYPH|nr:hypothetical protein [Microvirga terricola]NIX75977.1 hypothetical protein [Microvirga terricola]
MTRSVKWILLAVTLAAATPSSGQARKLDAFLGEFQGGCTGSDEYGAFVASLGEWYTSSGSLQNPIVAPEEIKKAMGPLRAVDRGEYVSISVPLAGTFKGLPVSGLEFELGNENGIHTEAILFASKLSEVRRLLGRSVVASRKTLAKKFPNSVPSIDIVQEKGQVKILCILSD